MLHACWMMLLPVLAAAFRADNADIVSSDGGGDELCCCYKKKQAYRYICVKDGMAYWTERRNLARCGRTRSGYPCFLAPEMEQISGFWWFLEIL
eukprot:s1958_g7.t1